MKFTSKNQNYHSPQANRGVFINPFVKYTSADIDPDTDRLTIRFALQYEENGIINTLERPQLQFTEFGVETKIENEQGESVEVMAYLLAGGIYDETKIIKWGTPTAQNVQAFFDLESVWSDLTFKDTPYKQLAIDWLKNKLPIEGLPLKENFELEVV